MKRSNKKLLAIIVGLALVIQYSIGAGLFTSYAEEIQGDTASNKTEAAAPEAKEKAPEPESEPAPAPKEKEPESPQVQKEAEPEPVETQAAEQTAKLVEDGTDTGQDGSGDVDTPEGEVGGTGDGENLEDPDAVQSEEPIESSEDIIQGEGEESGEDADDPDADEDEKYPEVTLSETVGGVTVMLHAPKGALPEGAKLRVTKVTRQDVFEAIEERMAAEGRVLTDAIAFDVTPLDKDGNEIQPKKAVSVTFSGTGLDVEAGGDVDVFRVSDDAGSVTEINASIANSDTQKFSANHFTIYATGSSVPDAEQGDGQSQTTRYIVPYGETITLGNKEGYNGGIWSDSSQYGGYTFNAWNRQLTNNRDNKTRDINITITHTYNKGSTFRPNWQTEYFYITCLREEFTVKFYLQDVEQTSPSEIPASAVTVFNGGKVSADMIPSLEEKEGSKLYAWYTDDTWSEKIDNDAITQTAVTKNTSYYAKYSGEATIYYKKNTTEPVENMPAPQTEGIGNRVILDSGASREGRSLDGWNTAADGSGDSYEPGQSIAMPEEGLTLYAQWKTNTIVITYYYNYGLYGQWESARVTANSRTRLLSDYPNRDGYVFRGWATNPIGDPVYMPDTALQTGSRNINLYARWGEIRTEDLDITSLTAKGEVRIYDGVEHTIDGVVEAEGKTLRDGRYLHVGAYGSGLLRQELYADVGGVTASGKDAGSYSTRLSAEIFRYDVVGLRFSVGQYLEIKNPKLVINPVELVVSTDSDEKLYDPDEPLTKGGKATYLDNDGAKHEVTFTPEGTAVSLIMGDTLNMRTTGKQSDVGQSKNGFEYDFGKPDDWGDAASTAKSSNYKFAKNPTFGDLTVYLRVDFDKNCDDEVSGMPDSVEAYEPEITPDAEIPSDEPSRTGSTFKGWATEAGGEAIYQPGDTIEGINVEDTNNGVLTLYAVWDTNIYTVTFADEDGTVISVKEYKYGTAAADIETPDDPKKASDGKNTYEFAGWDPEIADVTGDATYTATYTATPIPDEPDDPDEPDNPDDDDDDDNPAAAAAAAAAPPAGPAAPAEDIEDEPAPQAEPPATTIEDEPTPLANTWSVANLALAVITAVGAALALFRKREDADEYEDEDADRRMLIAKIAGALAGVAAPVTFFVTENFGGVAAAFDKWSPVMVDILGVQVVAAILNNAASKGSEFEEEAETE